MSINVPNSKRCRVIWRWKYRDLEIRFRGHSR